MTSSHPNLHGVYLNKSSISKYIETTMHNKPVKVNIQIKDRIKSQVIKKQVRTKENKNTRYSLDYSRKYSITPQVQIKKQVYWINTPVSFHCSFISGRIRGWFTKYGPPGIVLPRWPQNIHHKSWVVLPGLITRTVSPTLSQLHVRARTSAPAQSLTARRHMTSRPVALPHHDASKFLVGEPLVTTQPRRAELSKTQGCFLRGFYSRRKTL